MTAELTWTTLGGGPTEPLVDRAELGEFTAVINHGASLSGKPAWTTRIYAATGEEVKRLTGQGEDTSHADAEAALRELAK